MRNNSTKQEKHIWFDFLITQSNQFYRQRVIGNYIVDFYCPTLKFVIELDGSQHYEDEAIEYDKNRTEYLEKLGVIVLRFTNREIDSNFNEVCAIIEQTILSQLTLTAPLPKEPYEK